MAKDQNRRLNQKEIQSDKDVVAALVTLVPAYTPSNGLYSLANLQSAQTAMTTAQELEVQKKGEYDAARDGANAKEWAYHNAVLEAKKQVSAQSGSDSDQVQSVGLKKKSEYKKPARKAKPPTK